jgi:predicted metal-dependent phosphoesterase TrpH
MERLAVIGNSSVSKKGRSLASTPRRGQYAGVPSYRVDLHNHCQGDPVDALTHTIYEHIDQAKKMGLDALAMTWHRRVCSDEAAFAYARERGLLVMPGMEAEIDGKHLVVLGLRDGDLPGQTSWPELRALRARKPGVVVMAPHPFYPHPSCLNQRINDAVDCIDIVEWCALHVNWLPSRVSPNLRAARWAQRHGKPLVACSDAHSPAAIGRTPSTVEATALTEDAVLEAVRAGRVSFPRHSLEVFTFLGRTTAAFVGQRHHFGRWVTGRLRREGAETR